MTTLFIGNNTINTFLTTTGLSVNAVTIANTTGVYTGTVNAASHTVGTATVANATGIYTTGNVNAASHTTGDGGGASGGLTANVTTVNLGNTTVNAVATYSTFVVSNATSNTTHGSKYLQISASSGQPTVNLVNQSSSVGGRPAINFYATNTTSTTLFFGGINWLSSNAAGSFATIASITSQGDSFTSYKADIVAAVNANSNIVLQAGGGASNTLVGNSTGVYLFTNTLTVGTGSYFVSNGNVGIGTSSPGGKLEVKGVGSTITDAILRINNPNTSAYSTAILNLYANGRTRADIYGQQDNTGLGGFLIFNTSNTGGTVTEAVRIDSSGNFGIGNSNPTDKLSVNGIISDSIGPVRSIPVNDQVAGYSLASTDNGKVVSITTGGVTVNGALLTTGFTCAIFNNSASTQTITVGTGATMYLSGSTSANRTLAARGVCSLLMVASNTFVISGSLT